MLIVNPGRCRVCGCTDLTRCKIIDQGKEFVCTWLAADQTLCTNPKCVAEIPLPDLLKIPLMQYVRGPA